MHPFQEHKDHKVQRSRVGQITKGYASGGSVSGDDAPLNKGKLNKVQPHRDAIAVTGRPANQRNDRRAYAKGGKVKGKGTHVNVIVAPQGTGNAAPAPIAPPTPAGPMPVRPPMPMPPPGAGGPGGMPPGMPPRHSGGRTYARGGAVKPGPAWNEGRKAGTQVQHTNNKSDGANVGRGKPITYATGGAVEHPIKGGMGPKPPGGSGGGLARIFKAHKRHGNK